MTILQMSAYDNYINQKINFSDYKNETTDFTAHSGTLKDVCKVPWEAIHIDSRTHQTRAADTDRGHVAALAADIKNRSLERLPYVEWDATMEKFIPLTGHHRLFAIQKNNLEEGNLDALYPVAVVSFSDPLKREVFLQDMNNHRPVKPHSKEDAVQFVQRIKNLGFFGNSVTKKEVKNIVYPLLNEYYPRLYTKSKEEVLNKVFRFNTERMKTWQRSELKSETQRLYGHAYKSGEVDGDVCYIVSSAQNAGKIFHRALADRAVAQKRGNTASPLSIRMTVFFNIQPEELDSKRKRYLEEMACLNQAINSKIAVVSEVVFLHQLLTPASNAEKVPQRHQWDGTKFI